MKINGQKIKSLHTLGSWHDHGCLWGEAVIKGKKQTFRIHSKELLKMVNDFNFDVDLGKDDKRRKHIYLTVDASVYPDSAELTEETKELV